MGATYASNLYSGRETTVADLAWSGGTGFFTGGERVYKPVGINSVSSGLQAVQNNEDPLYAMGASVIATSSGAIIGKGIEKGGYRLAVGDISRNKGYYEPQYRNKQAMELLNSDYKYLPNKIGNVADSLSSEFINDRINKIDNKQGGNDEK